MTSGVAAGKSSSRISTWVHSAGAMNVAVGGALARSALPISITAYYRLSPRVRKRSPPGQRSPRAAWAGRRASRSRPPKGKGSPGAMSAVTTSAAGPYGHVGVGGAAGHMDRRHVPCTFPIGIGFDLLTHARGDCERPVGTHLRMAKPSHLPPFRGPRSGVGLRVSSPRAGPTPPHPLLGRHPEPLPRLVIVLFDAVAGEATARLCWPQTCSCLQQSPSGVRKRRGCRSPRFPDVASPGHVQNAQGEE